MIRVFQPADTTFTSNGDVVLRPLKATIRKEDNGDFYLDIECAKEFADYIQEGNIIVAPTPQGDQPFRITNPEYRRNKVKCRAWHLFYDSENVTIADSYVVQMDCNDALNHLNDACVPESPLTLSSDVETIASFRCVRKSLYEAIQTVLERWGGHLIRDGFDAYIAESIGVDNGVVVEYAKNLKEITKAEDWSEVTTIILPVGKDGILINDRDKTQTVYMYSETEYDIPYCKVVSFEQDIDEDDYKDGDEVDEDAYRTALVDDLKEQAQAWLDAHDLPAVNYTLKANLDKVSDIGDIIHVKDTALGINLLTGLIAYTYNCLTGKYTELEFGNFTPSLSNLVPNLQADVNKQVTDATSVMQTNINEVQSSVESVDNTLTQGTVTFDGSKLMVLDQLPQEDAVNVMRLTSAGWMRSSHGVNGTFQKFLGLDGKLDMSKLDVLNLTLSDVLGGLLRIGGASNGNGVIRVTNASGEVIGLLDNQGLTLTGTGTKVLTGLYNNTETLSFDGEKLIINNYDLFYRSGDSDSVECMCAGIAETGSVTFTVPMPRLSNGTVTVTGLTATVAGSAIIMSDHDCVADSSITITASASDRMLTVTLAGASLTTNEAVVVNCAIAYDWS